jgi:hypothetical protein
MNKNKISVSFVLAIALTLGSYVPALALENSIGASVDGSVNVTSKSGVEASVKASSSVNENSQSQSDNKKGSSNDNVKANIEVQSTTTGSETSTEHRSAVATFVQNLLSIANREGGIGNEVRVIAQEQNDSSSTTAEAIIKVEKKGGISAFLFGTDYKNLGVIRSELASTTNRIDRLSKLASSTINTQAKIELDAQIKLLQEDQAKVTAFVNTHENSFSLFGWFVKMFSK